MMENQAARQMEENQKEDNKKKTSAQMDLNLLEVNRIQSRITRVKVRENEKARNNGQQKLN